MTQTWISWIVCTLIVGSIIHELVTGKARVRGMGVYLRDENSVAYWITIACKAVLAVVIAAITLAFGR